MRRSSNAPSFRRTPAESWKFCHGRKRWGESETSAGLATSGIVTGRRRGKVMGVEGEASEDVMKVNRVGLGNGYQRGS